LHPSIFEQPAIDDFFNGLFRGCILHMHQHRQTVFLITKTYVAVLAAALLACACGSPPNNPYRTEDSHVNYYYDTFMAPPKHLDPVRSYSSDEAVFVCQVYEPPLQFHFLKRPYELQPLTAACMPTVSERGTGDSLQTVYEITIQPGILYQPHPCFARDEQGELRYHKLKDADTADFLQISDFKHTGTRELVAADYVLQLRRMADPRLNCPILSTMTKYILGLDYYGAAMKDQLEAERTARREAGGLFYNQTEDEKRNPIRLDDALAEFPGVELVDRYTYRIIIKGRYPQIKYWLAMPFFAPVPYEALSFYGQAPLIHRGITLDRFPVGTGAYYIETYQPNKEIILARNPNYRIERYPSEGEAEDSARGLLRDAGSPLPFIDKAVYTFEPEYITSWNKFLQGYYDTSGLDSDNFDQAVTMTEQGVALTGALKEKGIGLITAPTASIWYFAFNMRDEVVGGLDEKKCKLRQAISIAIDIEERLDIFNNGRGIPAHGLIPPGIFGYQVGREGMNPYVYDWDVQRQQPARKSIEEARRLLAEAGYPNGIGPDGRQLTISFDNMLTGSSYAPYINWIIKQFRKLNINLEINTTDYNRFQDKINSGNFQFFSWGWNADYPDPENFLFLLYGPNARNGHGVENTTGYASEKFDKLFRRMETMDNTPERIEIIRQIQTVLQHDAPLNFGFFPMAYSLYHDWYRNAKPNLMGRNNLKYKRIDGELRARQRQAWNRPVIWPLVLFGLLVVLACVPAVIMVWKREHRS
jgi:oligopeptide transport system substrate-binding protein